MPRTESSSVPQATDARVRYRMNLMNKLIFWFKNTKATTDLLVVGVGRPNDECGRDDVIQAEACHRKVPSECAHERRLATQLRVAAVVVDSLLRVLTQHGCNAKCEAKLRQTNK